MLAALEMIIRHASRPTDAERIDRAVSSVLDGEPAAVPPTLAGELATARALRDSLHPVPPGSAFEASLARRLDAATTPAADRRLMGFVRHHQRLVLTGAVGSVVVSTAGMAVVAWRHVHRSP
ncbi:MAG TPA: hypothetical protein VFP83_06400 [Candidatus Limnocylindria bacterium]|nr:hypothetical protein [Candidatus Limnocylindria bacterium]